MKMKKLLPYDEILARLEKLRNQQAHGEMKIAEEKTIIKEIDDLERSLPFAKFIISIYIYIFYVYYMINFLSTSYSVYYTKIII